MRQWYKTKNTLLCKNTKRGFLTVEAGILLPIFIIGVLTLSYVIKLMAVQEGVFHSFTDEARLLSSEAIIYKSAPFFESRLKNRLYEENPFDISKVDLEDFKYIYYYKGNSGIISMDLDYEVNIRLPIKFYESLFISETLIFRGFIGADEKMLPMAYEEMESEDESHLVWVFPKSGGRYHQENCTYIAADSREILLSNSIRRKYDPCSICKPSEISNGNLVYYFIKTGVAYHRGSCTTIDKYVISIEKEEAIEKKYTPCMKCGGG